MQNQASPVEILSPAIPSNWCPSGSWADVFNNYQTLFLNNSTVNIPGLGLVTPEQIATINQNIQNLQNEYNALAVNVRSGSVILTGGSDKYNLNFATAMPNSNYQIVIEPIAASGTASTSNTWSWALISGSKTTTGATVVFTYLTSAGVITGFNWTVSYIAST